jgi:hypothetical protein
MTGKVTIEFGTRIRVKIFNDVAPSIEKFFPKNASGLSAALAWIENKVVL